MLQNQNNPGGVTKDYEDQVFKKTECGFVLNNF